MFSKQPVMYLARVQRNIVEYLLDEILHYSNLLIWFTIVESIIIVILTLLCLLHLTAILVGQIYIPIEAMTLFLKENSLLLQKRESKPNNIMNSKLTEIENNREPSKPKTTSSASKRRDTHQHMFYNPSPRLQSTQRSFTYSQYP